MDFYQQNQKIEKRQIGPKEKPREKRVSAKRRRSEKARAAGGKTAEKEKKRAANGYEGKKKAKNMRIEEI